LRLNLFKGVDFYEFPMLRFFPAIMKLRFSFFIVRFAQQRIRQSGQEYWSADPRMSDRRDPPVSLTGVRVPNDQSPHAST
jgi:hypothetical protein